MIEAFHKTCQRNTSVTPGLRELKSSATRIGYRIRSAIEAPQLIHDFRLKADVQEGMPRCRNF